MKNECFALGECRPPPPPVPDVDGLASSFSTTYAGVLAFMAVVHEGSFARAAERLGIGRSAVSRSVQKLESQLDTRLFLRTTRNTSLTGEGELFYANCKPGVERIVQSVEDMRALRCGVPRGSLRLHAASDFGRKIVAPLLRGFHASFPDIQLDLILDDSPIDFIADRIDVSFRNGRLDDSELVARQLIPMQTLVCAAPAYAAQHGLPQTLDELSQHRCVNLRLPSGQLRQWDFTHDGQRRTIVPRAQHSFNDAELVLQAVLDGAGLAQLAGYQVCEHLRAGRLLACLAEHAPDDDGGHYLCYLSRHHLPPRIRVFVDYITPRIRALDLHCGGPQAA